MASNLLNPLQNHKAGGTVRFWPQDGCRSGAKSVFNFNLSENAQVGHWHSKMNSTWSPKYIYIYNRKTCFVQNLFKHLGCSWRWGSSPDGPRLNRSSPYHALSLSTKSPTRVSQEPTVGLNCGTCPNVNTREAPKCLFRAYLSNLGFPPIWHYRPNTSFFIEGLFKDSVVGLTGVQPGSRSEPEREARQRRARNLQLGLG